MMKLLVFAVLALALVVATTADNEPEKQIGGAPQSPPPSSSPFQAIKDHARKVTDKIKDQVNNLARRPSKRPMSSSSPKSKSQSQSQVTHASPKILAETAARLFGDADGSALFKNAQVVEESVAEVPAPDDAKLLAKFAKSKNSHSSRSHSSKLSSSARGTPTLPGQAPPPPPGRAPPVPGSRSSRSSSGESQVDPQTFGDNVSIEEHSKRMKRRVFNFKNLPNGADSVVIRKHHVVKKHHSLLVGFANTHSKVQLVLVVDDFKGPAGRPHQHKHKVGKKRGHKESDTSFTGVKHHNLFVFNEKGGQLFPSNPSALPKSPKSKPQSSSLSSSRKRKRDPKDALKSMVKAKKQKLTVTH